MTTKIRITLCALAAVAPACVALWAAESAVAPVRGRVLILENERVLEGEIEQVGDQYRVRRSVGETLVPGEKTLRLCQNLDEAYRFLRSQTNLRDADERVRLARWCQLHGLRAQALEEVKAAVELRPDRADSQRLLNNLQRWATLAATQPSSPTEKPEPGTILPPVELSAEALGLFASRVQPILMNTCASCHASGRGGAFKLARAYEGVLTNRRATQQNLAAVLAEINRSHPPGSPLLVRAVSVHGEAAQPPLKGRQAPAYRILEEWVEMVAADSQAEERPTPVAVVTAPAPPPVAEARAPKTEAAPAVSFAETAATKPAIAAPASPASPAAVAPAAAPATEPVDPFDPLIFNRQMHPSP